MNAPQRTRSCCRRRSAANAKLPRGAKQIVIPMDRATYDRLWHNAVAVRQRLHELLATAPELFPPGMATGFQLTGRRTLTGLAPIAVFDYVPSS